MGTTAFKEILESRFRANPNYELVLMEHLSAQEQELLGDLQKDSTLYGILRPRPLSALTYKSVDRETALLYLTLQQPAHLPLYVKTMFGAESNEALVSLVLNHILEIEEAGTFRSGAEACGAIAQHEPPAEATGTLAELSVRALQYAQALEFEDIHRLSMRLYFYNRLPITPEWQSRLPSSNAVSEFLGLGPGGANRVLVDRHWSQVSGNSAEDHWLMWQPARGRLTAPPTGATFKLYISPDPAAAAEVIHTSLAVLSASGTPMFKIGKDISGLFRPDKIVAYFGRREEMETAGDHLARELAGIKPHGVPFTAQLDKDGLLSWGMDPPTSERVFNWQTRESWRLWVTNRLASALVSAGASRADGLEPWQFALARLQLDGVNPQTWAPEPTLWQNGDEAHA